MEVDRRSHPATSQESHLQWQHEDFIHIFPSHQLARGALRQMEKSSNTLSITFNHWLHHINPEALREDVNASSATSKLQGSHLLAKSVKSFACILDDYTLCMFVEERVDKGLQLILHAQQWFVKSWMAILSAHVIICLRILLIFHVRWGACLWWRRWTWIVNSLASILTIQETNLI